MPSLYNEINLPTGIIYSIASAGTGQIVAAYTYDTWGNCEVQELSGYAIGDLNPFRYRGYYWDEESGMYYLNSRYYSPEFGRFISADSIVDNRGVITQNLFAYCSNNPVNNYDPTGHFLLEALGYLAVGVGIVLVCTTAYLTVNETAGAVKDVTESTMPKIQNRDQNVYVMRDKETKDVKYIGRTNDPVRRQKEHKKDPSKNNLDDLEVKFTGLTKTEARIVEQVLISAYTLDYLQNARREIAKGKIDAFAGKMQNIVSIFGGAVEDELLNLMGV